MCENPASNGSSASLRILGVDPAAAGPTGYAIIERQGTACRVLHYGAYQVPPKRQKSSMGAALKEVHALLCELIQRFKPDVIAVESIFTALNIRTALRLAEVRGVVLLAGEQSGVAVRSYSPREVKACVAGYGHADKRQIQAMVKAQLGMKELPEPCDAADALAVALCHLQTDRLERRFDVRKSERPETARPRAPKRLPIKNRAPRASRSGIQPER